MFTKSLFYNLIILFAVLAFLFACFSSIGLGMYLNGDFTCPAISFGGMCGGDRTLEHVSEWQGAFAALPIPSANLTIFYVFFLISLFIISGKDGFLFNNFTSANFVFSHVYEPKGARTRSFLYKAYSNGILNSKVF